jgi:hypothetical protein
MKCIPFFFIMKLSRKQRMRIFEKNWEFAKELLPGRVGGSGL